MSREHGSWGIGQVEGEFFDLGEGGHRQVEGGAISEQVNEVARRGSPPGPDRGRGSGCEVRF